MIPHEWLVIDGRVTLTFTGPAWSRSRTRSAINYCMDSLAPRVLKLGIVQGVYIVLILPWKCLNKMLFYLEQQVETDSPAPRAHGGRRGESPFKNVWSSAWAHIALASPGGSTFWSSHLGPACVGNVFQIIVRFQTGFCREFALESVHSPSWILYRFFVTVTILFFRVTISYMVFCHCGSAHSDYTVFIGAVMSRYSVTYV